LRAGHAHAGVYLVLSLVMLRYVDEAALSPFWKWLARIGTPVEAILMPAAFLLSVVSPTATQPNGLMNLAYIGALFLAGGALSLDGGPDSCLTARGMMTGESHGAAGRLSCSNEPKACAGKAPPFEAQGKQAV